MRLAALYDECLAVVETGDLDAAAVTLAHAEALLTSLRGASSPPASPDGSLDLVRARHTRLIARLANLRDSTRDAIRQCQHGRRALRGYGARSTASGRRITSSS
ncbi:MAG: hypothetical protein H6836_00120 [Planctomycetes bacterium]|nr:hypothetical protein [Planctomycetota bacterium]MCB9887945.1 hypothetical protein [Planctomycetota bacterium]